MGKCFTVSGFKGGGKYYFPYENECDLLTLGTADMPSRSVRRSRGELQGRKRRAECVFFS